MSPHQVLWLRNDLRLHDHEGFRLAQASGLPLTVVFILPEHWIARDELGMNRLGNAKATFLRGCLIDMQRSLSDVGLTLHILSGEPVCLLRELLGDNGTLITSEPQAPEESSWLKQLSDVRPVITYHSQTLFERQQLQPLLNDFPSTFSRFRRWLQKQPDIRIKQDISAVGLSLIDRPLTLSAPVSWPDQPGAVIRLPLNGGERIARQHLQDYIWKSRSISHYHQTRNQLSGLTCSSLFSAHLAWGALSVREIWRHLVSWEQLNPQSRAVRALKDELLWREFFHWSLVVHGTRVFRQRGLKEHASDEHTSDEHTSDEHSAEAQIQVQFDDDLWQAWCRAETGVPGIDAGLKELERTGFVSNRLRQNMASYLIHELRLDWRLGARWFEQHLIDADPASNYGNWAYIAGVGHNPRPVHRFHLNQQLRHYDPELIHLHHWLPELEGLTAEQILSHQSGEHLLTRYPRPVAPVPAPE